MFEVKKYQPQYKTQWDNFVSKSKNATFLFYRDFMEYHSDRFEDYSLVVFNGEKVVGLLPAHVIHKKIYSHLGLTYGGLILDDNLGVNDVCTLFNTLVQHLKGIEFVEIVMKIIPFPYHSNYNSALEFALYQHQAQLQSRELNYFIDLKSSLQIHKSKLKFKNKGFWNHLEIKSTTAFSVFWNELLIPVLKEQYNAAPVHTLSEIELLAKRFPENIKQYNVFLNEECIAGITLFISKSVVKSQYGVANAKGKEYRALDYLYITLLEHFKEQNFSFFDMGTTNT